jgi:hypothetical protein
MTAHKPHGYGNGPIFSVPLQIYPVNFVVESNDGSKAAPIPRNAQMWASPHFFPAKMVMDAQNANSVTRPSWKPPNGGSIGKNFHKC